MTPARLGTILSDVDEDSFVASRRARMRWNTPLAQAHADLLLDRLDLCPGTRIVDLGCGWGELLMRAVERADVSVPAPRNGAQRASGVGVDTDPVALGRGQVLARERGMDGQIAFVEADAASWRGSAERALCVGSSHAFGGSRAALEVLADVVPLGGRILFGDGCWPGPTSPAALDIFGDQVLSLTELIAASRAAGWRTIHMSTADQREWDDFESTSRAGRQEWLLANGTDPRAAEVRDWLDTREDQYIHTYRGVLGFAYLILTH